MDQTADQVLVVLAALPVSDPFDQMLVDCVGFFIFCIFLIGIGKIPLQILLQLHIVLFCLLLSENIMRHKDHIFLGARCFPFNISGEIKPEQFRTVGFHLL